MNIFYKYLLLTSIFVCCYTVSSTQTSEASALSECEQVYHDIGLQGIVNYEAFEQAYKGYKAIEEIEMIKKSIITLVDFSKPSTEKRLYVLDIESKEMLFCSHVAHGRNSGGIFATSFSNKVGSYKSSLGFYLTENTYEGSNGYSLIINGLEKGINDKAKERAVVIHGAPYCNPDFIENTGRLGRSYGCPALPESVNAEIIDTIKDGSLLYIFANNNDYLSHSTLLAGTKIAAL